jgi:hypothetical protein
MTYDSYTHDEDGRVCIWMDNRWFVPLDAGGEGFECERLHAGTRKKYTPHNETTPELKGSIMTETAPETTETVVVETIVVKTSRFTKKRMIKIAAAATAGAAGILVIVAKARRKGYNEALEDVTEAVPSTTES